MPTFRTPPLKWTNDYQKKLGLENQIKMHTMANNLIGENVILTSHTATTWEMIGFEYHEDVTIGKKSILLYYMRATTSSISNLSSPPPPKKKKKKTYVKKVFIEFNWFSSLHITIHAVDTPFRNLKQRESQFRQIVFCWIQLFIYFWVCIITYWNVSYRESMIFVYYTKPISAVINTWVRR